MNAQPAYPDSPQDLKRRVQWLMFCRVLIASLFLGMIALTQLQVSESFLAPFLVYIYGLIGSVYFFTFVYVLIMPYMRNMGLFASAQMGVDLLLVTALLYITGGINSIFSFMYSIVIIAASILLYLRGGLLTATIASCLYALLIILQHTELINPLDTKVMVATGYLDAPLYLPIMVNITTFYLVALLASFLAEQARRSHQQLQEKQVDIAQLQALNENIIQSISSGLVTLDHLGRIITFNRAAEEITGLERTAVYLKRVEEVFTGMDLPPAAGSNDALKPLVNPRFETTFVRQDGRQLCLGFSLSALKDSHGREIGKILAFQDLTSLKEMQSHVQRMDRLAAVGRLAAGIAHEVRNPLASISGSVQVLKKDLKLDDTDQRLMDIIIRESNNLSVLISEFTQFARSGKPAKERLVLKFIVDEILDIFKNSPECKHISVIQQDIDAGIWIKANYQQCKQVLWNLLINAAQAILHDSGRISISARIKANGFQPPLSSYRAPPGPESPVWCEIRITDTGCGIDPKDINRIFDPFYTTKDHGTGLGLSIVHKIIQDHGGAISLESQKDHGTTFTVYLPQ